MSTELPTHPQREHCCSLPLINTAYQQPSLHASDTTSPYVPYRRYFYRERERERDKERERERERAFVCEREIGERKRETGCV